MADMRVEQHKLRNSALILVKVVHTAIWAFFAACILALPVAGGPASLRLGHGADCAGSD
jgi:hypothetical protein